jgi:hypothetical protein
MNFQQFAVKQLDIYTSRMVMNAITNTSDKQDADQDFQVSGAECLQEYFELNAPTTLTEVCWCFNNLAAELQKVYREQNPVMCDNMIKGARDYFLPIYNHIYSHKKLPHVSS